MCYKIQRRRISIFPLRAFFSDNKSTKESEIRSNKEIRDSFCGERSGSILKLHILTEHQSRHLTDFDIRQLLVLEIEGNLRI